MGWEARPSGRTQKAGHVMNGKLNKSLGLANLERRERYLMVSAILGMSRLHMLVDPGHVHHGCLKGMRGVFREHIACLKSWEGTEMPAVDCFAEG
jgi:hypothetical protein